MYGKNGEFNMNNGEPFNPNHPKKEFDWDTDLQAFQMLQAIDNQIDSQASLIEQSLGDLTPDQEWLLISYFGTWLIEVHPNLSLRVSRPASQRPPMLQNHGGYGIHRVAPQAILWGAGLLAERQLAVYGSDAFTHENLLWHLGSMLFEVAACDKAIELHEKDDWLLLADVVCFALAQDLRGFAHACALARKVFENPRAALRDGALIVWALVHLSVGEECFPGILRTIALANWKFESTQGLPF